MDPNHHDRIAFVRLCSGKLARGMKVKQTRTAKPMSLRAPQFFFAENRALAEEAQHPPGPPVPSRHGFAKHH
jgi:peptide chain release factor 3